VVVADVLIGKDPEIADDSVMDCAVAAVLCAAACSATGVFAIVPVHPLPTVLVPENCVVPLHANALGVVCTHDQLDVPVNELQDAATVKVIGFSVDVPSLPGSLPGSG
jgi:hypothetical protein